MKNFFLVFFLFQAAPLAFGKCAAGKASGDFRPSVYWVVETNTVGARYSVIRIYDRGNDRLVREEQIDNVILDVRHKATRRRLNKAVRTYETWIRYLHRVKAAGWKSMHATTGRTVISNLRALA